jgi:hypothetical protein
MLSLTIFFRPTFIFNRQDTAVTYVVSLFREIDLVRESRKTLNNVFNFFCA